MEIGVEMDRTGYAGVKTGGVLRLVFSVKTVAKSDKRNMVEKAAANIVAVTVMTVARIIHGILRLVFNFLSALAG